MKITFYPIRSDHRPVYEVWGDTLVIDGESFDLSGVAEGCYLPVEAIDSQFFADGVERKAGELHVSLFLTHGANAPIETRFPTQVVTETAGAVPQPPFDTEPVMMEVPE
jgi:hypothetical protein